MPVNIFNVFLVILVAKMCALFCLSLCYPQPSKPVSITEPILSHSSAVCGKAY